MISPDGFTPLSEVSYRVGQIYGQNADELYEQLIKRPIFVVIPTGQALRLEARVLSRCKGDYAFIDDRSWTVKVGILFDQKKVTLNPEYIAMTIPDGTKLSDERMKTLRRTEIASQVIAMIDADGGAELNFIPLETIYQIDEFDGMPLCIRDSDAKDVTEAMARDFKRKSARPPGRPRKVELAVEHISDHWPDGNYPSLKEIAHVLLVEYGLEIGVASVRKARKIAASGHASAPK